ncbi:protein snakeskin-like [Periplaneta americana]|uniref:protein snakeskin-like n=1 Tax=Periplaneta americana TaxID=6978 RepID=UPI0037E7AE86
MATLPTSPTDKTTQHPQRPKLPLLQLKSFSSDPGGMSPCSTPRSNMTWMERRQSALQLVNQQNISPVYFHVPVSSYIFKLTQLLVTIICTGTYSEGVNAVTSSTNAQMIPYFVCSTYMIITPVILISYVLGHRMPEVLVRIFNTLGGILFLMAGIVALMDWRSYRDKHSGRSEYNEVKAAMFLLATGVLCLANSLIYLADVARSVHTYLAEP